MSYANFEADSAKPASAAAICASTLREYVCPLTG